MMTRYINILLLAIFLLQGCSSIKGLFGKKSIGDPNDPDFLNRVQELKSAYRGGNIRCLLYTSPSPRDQRGSRMPSSA